MSATAALLVRVSWVPVRAEPSHRAEMVTQGLCGEVFVPLEERDGWLRVRGPDAYEGWCGAGGLLGVGEEAAAAWAEEADLYSLGVGLAGPAEPAAAVRPWPRRLPWGARVAPAPAGRVRLPDARVAVPEDPSGLADPATLRRRFPAGGPEVVATAATWAGTPYVWGGRTRHGADCSGFVQAVYAAHGVGLPRDSGDQLAAGPEIERAADPAERRPGDLLFFGASRSEVTHVALSLGGTAILHAAAANGGVAADDLDALPERLAHLAERLVGASRPGALSPR